MKNYFVTRTYELMVNHYGYDLVKEVVLKKHEINSTDLKVCISTKIVDIERTNEFASVIFA